MAFSCTIKFSLALFCLYQNFIFRLTVAVQICQHSKGDQRQNCTMKVQYSCHPAAGQHPERLRQQCRQCRQEKDNGIEQTKEFCCLLKARRHIDIFSSGSFGSPAIRNAHGSPFSFHANTASVIPRRRKQPNAIHPLTFQHLLCSTVSVSPP